MINAGAIINNPEPHLQHRFLYNPSPSGPTVLQVRGRRGCFPCEERSGKLRRRNICIVEERKTTAGRLEERSDGQRERNIRSVLSLLLYFRTNPPLRLAALFALDF